MIWLAMLLAALLAAAIVVILAVRRDAAAARAEAAAWHDAYIEIVAVWMRRDHGEAGEKVWRQMARYNPPEVVREMQPAPRIA